MRPPQGRRQRVATVGVVVALVAVLAALPALTRTGGLLGPADRHGAPETRSALGFPYTFHRARHSDGTSVTMALGRLADGEPALVSWTTDDPSATVTVATGDGDPIWSSDEGGYRDHVVLDRVLTDEVVLTSSDPGVTGALYVRDEGGEVEGFNEGGFRFRDRVDGDELLTAVIGEPGQSELTVTVPAFTGGVRVAYQCHGFDEDGLETSVFAFDGPTGWIAGTSSCHGDFEHPDVDKASGLERIDVGGLTTDAPVPGAGAADTMTFRMTVGQRDHGDRSRPAWDLDPTTGSPSGVMAVAVYRAQRPHFAETEPGTSRLDDSTPFDVVTAMGHTWRLEHDVTTSSTARDTRTAGTTLDGDGPWLAAAEHLAPGPDLADRTKAPRLSLVADGDPMPAPDPTPTDHAGSSVVADVHVPLGTTRLETRVDPLDPRAKTRLKVWRLDH